MITATRPPPQTDGRASRVELIFRQIEQLPTLPAVAARLLQVTASQASNASDVAAVIETDSALTAKVLALVRSAAVAARDVTSIERAIVLLGFETVRNAVLSVQIYDTFKAAEPQVESPFERQEFWKHSLAVGCAARLIALELRRPKLEGDAFVCGLLHDMGKLALDACLPKSYARVIRQTLAANQPLCEVEGELLGLDHTVAGKRLAARWKLPTVIGECTWLHHHPPDALPESISGGEVVRIVHLADRLVRQQRIGFSGNLQPDSSDAAAQAVGLSPEGVTRVLEALPAEIERNCKVVGICELSGTTIYVRALAEANAALGRMNAALADSNRRLKARSGCFEALSGFTRSLTLDNSIADVCLAAAQCVRHALGVGTAVGFWIDAEGGFYHVGVADGDDAKIETISATGLESVSRVAPFSGPIGPAPSLAEPIVQRYERVLGLGPHRMLPMIYAGLMIGGVVFPNEPEAGTGVNPADEFEALSAALGLAVASAADRARSDRLTEDLASAGRKLHEAQSELFRVRALEAVVEVAAGAAHELNNPLAVISGRAQLLAQGSSDAEVQRAAAIIQDHAHRASEIISDLMQFAKPERPSPALIDLGAWLNELCDRWIARSSLRAGQLEVRLSDPQLSVYADPAQLQRVFDALLANAVEATKPDSAKVHINSASRSSDDRVVVTVKDNGAGMSAEVLQHAADPFFSHRAAGRGRGMGLSHAARLTAHNGGRLWLESTAGAGTTAHVELPARPVETAQA